MRMFRSLVAVVIVGSITIAMTATALAAPSNDDFDNSTLLNWDTAGGTHVFSITNQTTAGATSETGEPSGGVGDTESVWFLWTTSGAWDNQEFKVATTVSNPSITLNVYTGTEVNALTLVAGDNDGIGVPFVSFDVTATFYWIRVATLTGFPLGFDLVWGTEINAPPPVPPAPDAAIRTGSSGSEFKQFGFTSDVATKQQTAKDTAAPGVSKTFQFRVENDGDFPGPFTVTGDPATNGFRVKYYDENDNNITSAVVNGVYEVNDVDPGARSPVLKVRIKPSGHAAVNSKARPVITFESEDGEVDVLRAQLKRV